jgi:hypothetical protein
VALEPTLDSLYVLGRNAEVFGILLGSEPLVKAWRGGVTLVFEKRVESGLLRGRGLENEDHAPHGKVRGDRSGIELRAGEWMVIAGQQLKDAVIDRDGDSRRGARAQWIRDGGLVLRIETGGEQKRRGEREKVEGFAIPWLHPDGLT